MSRKKETSILREKSFERQTREKERMSIKRENQSQAEKEQTGSLFIERERESEWLFRETRTFKQER